MHTILYDRKSSQIEHVSRRVWRYQRGVTRICNYKKDRQHNTIPVLTNILTSIPVCNEKLRITSSRRSNKRHFDYLIVLESVRNLIYKIKCYDFNWNGTYIRILGFDKNRSNLTAKY